MGNRGISFLQNIPSGPGRRRESHDSSAREGPDRCLRYGAGVLFFLFSSILVSAVGFFLRVPITSYHFFISAALTVVFVIIVPRFSGRRGRFDSLTVLALLGSSFFLFLAISKSFFDISYDGQAYHQEALVQLQRGWNPFYDPLLSSQTNNMDYWLTHYAKGVWIYSAMVCKVTQNIESGKLFHLWLMAAVFSLALSFLLRFEKLPRAFAFLLSLLLACNPVSVCQSLSFYLDGQLMSLMVIMIVVLGFIYREPRGLYLLLLCLGIAVLINTKLTAGIYAGMLMVGYMGMLWVQSEFQLLRRVARFTVAGLVIGFILMGFSPYVTNTLAKGNPFYPALGTDRAIYTFPQFPANFIGKSSFSLLFHSIFSKSDNVRGPEKKASLKIPFTVSREELTAFTDTNAKQGGFGPLFGGAVLMSFIILLGALAKLLCASGVRIRRPRPFKGGGESAAGPRGDTALGLFCLALILTTCLINPASSLARFIPQMWLFPVIAAMLAYALRGRFFRMVGYFIILTLFVNALLVAFVYYGHNVKITRIYHERLERLATMSKEHPLQVYFGHFRTSAMLRFDQYGIDYRALEKKEDCLEGRRILPHSIILQCAAREPSSREHGAAFPIP